MRIDGQLAVSQPAGTKQDRVYSAEQVIDALDGAPRSSAGRTSITASYSTDTESPTVYFTALKTNGDLLVARSTGGVTLSNGLYRKTVDTTALTDFLAVWDEGDVTDYISEWIVVDT